MDQKPVGAQVDAPVPSRDARTARLERRCYAKTLRAIQPIRELNSVSSLVSVRIATAMRKSAHFPDSSKCVLHFLEREEWLNGTEEEKRAILRRKVLELVKARKMLGSSGASTSIGRSNGMGKRIYTRYALLRYGQGKDEEQQTFAPVVKGTTIHILFALPSCPICLLIDRTSFCSADLSGSEKVYLGKLPDEEMPDGYCFRLRKARYGLRLSPRNWRSTSR